MGLFGVSMNAQTDTLWWDNFNGETWDIDPNDGELLITTVGNKIKFGSSAGTNPFLPANYTDELAYSYDFDGELDANDRPEAWFRSLAFADVDTIPFDAVMGSSSWLTNLVKTANYFILPSFYATSDMELSWFSAPFQAPMYLDGYKVVISTATNSPYDFLDTVFVASEFTAFDGVDSAAYSSYTFAPANGYVHGAIPTELDQVNFTSIARKSALLTKHSLNIGTLAGGKFANKNIFIAFLHDSEDDNLLSIDNVLLTGTKVDNTSVEVNSADVVGMYPNPATSDVTLTIKLDNANQTSIQVIDATGKVVLSKNAAMNNGFSQVQLDVANLASGIYTVKVTSAEKSYARKLIKK